MIQRLRTIKVDDRFFVIHSGKPNPIRGPYKVTEIKKTVFKLSDGSGYMRTSGAQHGTSNSWGNSVTATPYSESMVEKRELQFANSKVSGLKKKVSDKIAERQSNFKTMEEAKKEFDALNNIYRLLEKGIS